jgi:hypothetical protein
MTTWRTPSSQPPDSATGTGAGRQNPPVSALKNGPVYRYKLNPDREPFEARRKQLIIEFDITRRTPCRRRRQELRVHGGNPLTRTSNMLASAPPLSSATPGQDQGM